MLIREIIPTWITLGEWILTFINASLIFILSTDISLWAWVWGLACGIFPLTGWIISFFCLKKLYPLINLVLLCFTWFQHLYLVITVIKFFLLCHRGKKSFQKTDSACFDGFSELAKINATLENVAIIKVVDFLSSIYMWNIGGN